MSMVVSEKPDYGNLTKNHADFHTSQFDRNRRTLLSELRCMSGLPELVRSLSPETLYRLVLPEGRVLQQSSDGLFRGVFYGERGIQRHAKFAQARQSLLNAAQAAGCQVLLISIAMQLNRIEKSLDDLSAELHRDRLAEIDAGSISLKRQYSFKIRHIVAPQFSMQCRLFIAEFKRRFRNSRVTLKRHPTRVIGFAIILNLGRARQR